MHPVEQVADTDLDLFQPVKNIDLGQRNPGDARNRRRLAHQHSVEPAATPFAPRDHTEFMSSRTKEFAYLIVLFGRERARADAGCISLYDPQYEAHPARADP